jgi:predicted DNA-binding protein
MAKSISVNGKKRGRGRPATGVDPVMAFRLPAALKEQVEKQAQANGEKPADVLRRIVEKALKGKR